MSKRSESINGSRILITGGTGSFGNYIVERIINDYTPKEIIVFSRDEKKQYDMYHRFKNYNRLKLIIGDIRSRVSVFKAMRNVDYVFHAAALKQVPTCEFYPDEAVKTNIIGAINVLDASEESNVKKIVVLSTDKAVYPINAMGMTKAIMEKLMLAKARLSKSDTVFCGVRYGNVVYSRGSVIPLFVSQIKKNTELTITNPSMTRYLLPLSVAIELVLFALEKGQNGDILVRKSPAATVETIADALLEIFNYHRSKKIIGIREGEKIHETLISKEELMKSEDNKEYFRIKNLSNIDYNSFFVKSNNFPELYKEGYTSENTRRLQLKETKELLLSLQEIKKELK